MSPELCATLLSWAVTLSGYPSPGTCPEVVVVDHAYLEQHACSGHNCRVLGWYPSQGHKVYLDARLDKDLETNIYANSILLHEFVHYLQWTNNKLDDFNCEVAVQAEREAYAVQRRYTDHFGTFIPVGQSVNSFHCEGVAATDPAPAEVMEEANDGSPTVTARRWTVKD